MAKDFQCPEGYRILEDETPLEVGDAIFYNIVVPHFKEVIRITPSGSHATLENTSRVPRIGAIGKRKNCIGNIHRLRKI